jgi:predicted SprT family Zn-dependent metalloprotease
MWADSVSDLLRRRRRAWEFARDELDRHGFRNVAVSINPRFKRLLGRARWVRRQPALLELAEWHVERSEWDEVRETILHEVAHFIAGSRAGHGPSWQAAARQVGAAPVRCAPRLPEAPGHKWEGSCRSRCAVFRRHRLTKRVRLYGICPECAEQIFWKEVGNG